MFNIIEFANQLKELVDENIYLQKENEALKKQVKEHQKFIDNLFEQSRSQMVDILTSLIK